MLYGGEKSSVKCKRVRNYGQWSTRLSGWLAIHGRYRLLQGIISPGTEYTENAFVIKTIFT